MHEGWSGVRPLKETVPWWCALRGIVSQYALPFSAPDSHCVLESEFMYGRRASCCYNGVFPHMFP